MNIEELNELRKKAEKDIYKVLDDLEKESNEFEIDEFNGHRLVLPNSLISPTRLEY